MVATKWADTSYKWSYDQEMVFIDGKLGLAGVRTLYL